MTNTKEILGRLKKLREEKNLKQEQVAQKLGIERTTYVRKEKGLIPITTEEWLKLADALGVDLSRFFNDSIYASKEESVSNQEGLLLELCRSLSQEERNDFISSIRLILKGVNRKQVQEILKRLSKI